MKLSFSLGTPPPYFIIYFIHFLRLQNFSEIFASKLHDSLSATASFKFTLVPRESMISNSTISLGFFDDPVSFLTHLFKFIAYSVSVHYVLIFFSIICPRICSCSLEKLYLRNSVNPGVLIHSICFFCVAWKP